MALSLIFDFSAYAGSDNEKSYIITFKKPEQGVLPFIQSPIKKNNDEDFLSSSQAHGSETYRQEISDELSLQGEVVSVFGSINAIAENPGNGALAK
jgi:hypothetical protein